MIRIHGFAQKRGPTLSWQTSFRYLFRPPKGRTPFFGKARIHVAITILFLVALPDGRGQLANFRFTGHVADERDSVVDSFAMYAGWRPVSNGRFEGRFSFDTQRIENTSTMDHVGVFRQVHPISFELIFDDFSFSTSDSSIEIHNDVPSTPLGGLGIEPNNDEVFDAVGISTCLLVDSSDNGNGLYSMSAYFHIPDANFVQDENLNQDLSIDSFEFAAGFLAWAKTGPGFVFTIDSVERIEDSVLGDLNRDGLLTAADIDLLQSQVRDFVAPEYDFDGDLGVDFSDVRVLVKQIFGSNFGDSNLDGRFDSADLVAVFESGQYEDNIRANSTWSTGDWNGDREFDTSDLILAFQSGGYEQEPMVAVHDVPEPTQIAFLFLLLACWVTHLRAFARRT